MASIVLISATSRSSGIQAFEANHLVSSYLWFSPLPFRWQQFECEKLEFPGIYKSIIKLANHPTLLQPNLPHSGVVSNIQNLLHKRVELNYPFHARFVVTESNLASRRMIQDLMTALLSSLSAGCSCAIWNFRRTVRSGDITTCYRWWKCTRQEWTGADLSRFWSHEDSWNFTDGFWTKMVK